MNSEANTGLSYSGSTADFESSGGGSIPSRPTNLVRIDEIIRQLLTGQNTALAYSDDDCRMVLKRLIWKMRNNVQI
jgi:hypothetical protein